MVDRPDKVDILNCGLWLAMEWGENWLKPIQSRLAQEFPGLSPDELDQVNVICQAVMKFGNNLVYSMAETNRGQVDEGVWKTAVSHQYPWVDDKNYGRLFSQGMYYAWKDGLIP